MGSAVTVLKLAGEMLINSFYHYILMVNSVRVFSILVLVALFTSFVQASASPLELSHDDGKYDYGWSDFYPYAAMVKFTPPSAGYKLKAIKLHAVCFLRGYANFYVQIWDSNLNTPYWATFTFNQIFKNNTLEWYAIDLPNVVITGEFYVVIIPMFALDGPQLWISVDDDPPISNASFIIDVDSRTILASLNATSKKPGDFMVRVVGEPTLPLPEVKLNSIEVNEDEIILSFTYPGEVKSSHATLMKSYGNSFELNVTRVGSTLIVKTNETGTVNLYVITPDSELIGTSVKVGGNLIPLYKELLANYTLLKLKADSMQNTINSLVEENSALKLSLGDMEYAFFDLRNRISELIGNLTSQKQQVAELSESLDNLRRDNGILAFLLVVAIMTPILTFLTRRLKERKWT